MDDRQVDDLIALLPPLLEALDRLGFVARHLNPPDFAGVMDAVGEPDVALREPRARLDGWPAELAEVRDALLAAIDAATAGFEALRAAQDDPEGLAAVFRALRYLPRAEEALYPLARGLAPVSRYFLEPALRGDDETLRRLANTAPRPDIGIGHVDNEPGSRGGFSLYVPEDYSPDRALPIVFALHGGSGNGRGFLWSWVRAARSRGAILVAPTAVGPTWALQGQDADTPNLARILDMVRSRWNVDPTRMLLTGMSDGGTFSYVSGLEPGSPFTHLAPVSAAFHPMMAQFADRDRVDGRPIHIVHGVLDWMFPVSMAREAAEALSGVGARVVYREVEDLSHAYPRELNAPIVEWVNATA